MPLDISSGIEPVRRSGSGADSFSLPGPIGPSSNSPIGGGGLSLAISIISARSPASKRTSHLRGSYVPLDREAILDHDTTESARILSATSICLT